MSNTETSTEGMLKKPDRAQLPFKHLLVRSYDDATMAFHLQSDSGESRLGVVYQGSPMTGADDGAMERLKSVLTTTMPAGSFITFGLLSEPDASGETSAYKAAKYEASALLKKLTTGHAEQFEKGVLSPIRGMDDVHIGRKRLIISLTMPCDDMPSDIQKQTISELSEKLRDGMTSVGLWMVQMNEAQYLALLRRFFKLYDADDFVLNEFAPTREQVFGPGDAVMFGQDHISFNDGQYFAKVLSVKSFPKIASIGLMNMLIGDPLGQGSQLNEPFWMSATIHYPDQNKKVTAVRTKHAWITNQQFGGMARFIPVLGYKKEGIDTLIYEMDGGGVLCELNFTVTLFSRSMERLNGTISNYRAWAASYGYVLQEDKRILKALYYTVLPMNASVNGIQNLFRFHTLAMSHAVQLLPIIGDWNGTGHGGASLLSLRRGTLASFDPYHSTTSYNGVIFAESGAGKSVAGQAFLVDWMAEGARAWVIDQGRSYMKLCLANKGQHIEFSEESDLCLNPFTKIQNIDEEMDLLKAMFGKMAAPNQGLDDFASSVLEEKIKSAYSKMGNRADVEEVIQQCLGDTDARIQDIGRQLFPFSRQGVYGRWFNGVNNVDMNNDFVVFEMKELENKKHLQQVVMIQLFASISHEMYHTLNRKKILLLEEAWALLDDPIMGKAVEIAYRTIRKHEGSAWMVLQDIGSVYESPNGRAIMSSCAWQIVMKQKSESIDAAIRSGHLKLGLFQQEMMKSIKTMPGKYAEMMIRNGDDWGVVRLIIDRFAQILYSSKGWERDEIFEMMQDKNFSSEDMIAQIEQWVEEGR